MALPALDAELLKLYRGAPTSIISDNLDRLAGSVGLRPFHKGSRMIGRARTVRTRAGDNMMIHQALELLEPGDVVVVDGGGDCSRALVGEIMKTIAESKGAAGFVIDGAIRDAGAFAESTFGCYALAANHRGPYKTGPGEIDVTVSIGGWTVSPGDFVVGDEDGIVSFSPATAQRIADAVRAQMAREDEILKSIREGRYKGAYAKPA